MSDREIIQAGYEESLRHMFAAYVDGVLVALECENTDERLQKHIEARDRFRRGFKILQQARARLTQDVESA